MNKLKLVENICIYGTMGCVGLFLFLTMHSIGAYAAASMVILLTGFGFFIVSITRKDSEG